MAGQRIFQFYAGLDDYEPMIWRKFQVRESIRLADLCYLVMIMFEMKAEHLFNIGIPDKDDFDTWLLQNPKFATMDNSTMIEEFLMTRNLTYDIFYQQSIDDQMPMLPNVVDITKHFMLELVSKSEDFLVMRYDFGDNWNVMLLVDSILEDQHWDEDCFVKVLDGQGYGIIENCGGVYGLEKIAKACKKKRSKEYRNYCEWLEVDSIDLENFDLAAMHDKLLNFFDLYQRIYEMEFNSPNTNQMH